MTTDTAKRLIRIYPIVRRSEATADIEEKRFVTVETVPVFELDGNCYQFTVDYKIKLKDGNYIYGRTMNMEEFAKLHESASKGKTFRIMYLENSRLILEIEQK